jgi:lipopolysaccharide transport system permease protein
MGYFGLTGTPVFTVNSQQPTVNILIIPLILLLMASLGLGLGILISSITTKYRDLTVLIGFGVQLLMYASAVNYPLSTLQNMAEKYPALYAMVKYNPLAATVESFRNSLLGLPVNYGSLAYAGAWALVMMLLGIWLFSRVERTFMDTV